MSDAAVVEAGINFQHPDMMAEIATQEAREQAAAAQASGQATSLIEDETPSPQTEPRKKYAGKYDSIEKFEEGYWNSAQEAQRIAQENKTLKELLSANTRVQPAARVEEREDFVDELRDAAIPMDALERLINQRATRAVLDALEPIARGAQARNEMLEQFPDYEKSEKAVQAFLSVNPSVNEEVSQLMAAGLERQARKLAFLEYARQNPSPRPNVDASGQAQAVARATGALSGNTTEARSVSSSFENKLRAAQDRFDIDHDERALAAVALMGLHPDMAKP
jgi:hypothetical protein